MVKPDKYRTPDKYHTPDKYRPTREAAYRQTPTQRGEVAPRRCEPTNKTALHEGVRQEVCQLSQWQKVCQPYKLNDRIS